MTKFQRSLFVAKQIRNGEWVSSSVWGYDSSKSIVMPNTDVKMWVGHSPLYCTLIKPVQYDAFGFPGKFIVWFFAYRMLKRDSVKALERHNAEIEATIDNIIVK
jgi:hypothetical protein